MRDREIIQWLRDEAKYWNSEYISHPDGDDAARECVRMTEAAAKRLEELSAKRNAPLTDDGSFQ